MTTGGCKSNKKAIVSRQGISLSEQTHLQILDYLQIASENSDVPAIRDAAIGLAKDKNEFLQKQTARLSPTLTLLAALLILVVAGVSSWLSLTYFTEHIAIIFSGIAIGLALVGVCLLAMFAGQLSQANFLAVVKMVWFKISSIIPKWRDQSEMKQITANADSDSTTILESDSKR
jgi:hypothetical protein